MHDIFLAITDAEVTATYPVVMQQLLPGGAEGDYVARVRALERHVSYKLLCLRKDQRIAAVAGFRMTASLA